MKPEKLKMSGDEEKEDRRKYNPGRPKGSGDRRKNNPGRPKGSGQTAGNSESENAGQAPGKSRGRPKKDAQE